MRLRVTLLGRIAATVAVAVLGSTVVVTYAAYELERSGSQDRFLAAAQTGASADRQQAAAAIARQPDQAPSSSVARFVEQRDGISWVVLDEDGRYGGMTSGGGITPSDVPDPLRYGRFGHAWVRVHGVRMLAIAAPVDGGPLLVEFYDYSPVQRQLDRLRSDLIRLDIVGVLIAAGLGLLVAARISRPVRLTATAAQRLGAGDLEARVPVHGRDELADLATSFNDMAQRLANAQRQQRRFVSDVSHELRTPLAAMLAAADGLDSPDPRLRERAVHLVAEQTRRMNNLVESLLEISRFDAGQASLELDAVDLAALARDAQRTVAPQAHVRFGVAGDVRVHADARRLHTIMRNLLANAVQHGAEPVEVLVDGRGDPVLVTVADGGPGVDPELLPLIFDRFVRADRSRGSRSGSTGLGLAIALENARLHGATLQVATGGRSAFVLSLPRRAG